MPSIKNHTWVCRNCGKRTTGAEKPGALHGGKCPKSSGGTHSWVKA